MNLSRHLVKLGFLLLYVAVHFVVHKTVNYTIIIAGFLSTEDESAMGNYALMDISQALLWLRENIASFNGDPQRVTLFGHGHGSAIVNLLMLSPFVMGKIRLFCFRCSYAITVCDG